LSKASISDLRFLSVFSFILIVNFIRFSGLEVNH